MTEIEREEDTMNALEELASLPCKKCGGRGQVCPRDNEWQQCPVCNGTGALVPGLRQKCPYGCYERVMQVSSDSGQKWTHKVCDVCGDKRWTVVPEAEAFLVMAQWCSSHSYIVAFWPEPKSYVTVRQEVLGRLGPPNRSGGTDAESLAAAIIKVKR